MLAAGCWADDPNEKGAAAAGCPGLAVPDAGVDVIENENGLLLLFWPNILTFN